MEQVITESELKVLKKIIHKNKENDELTLAFEYQGKKYRKPCDELKQYEEYLSAIEAFNIKDYTKRMSYIYDYLCRYMDEDMTSHGYCEFEGDTCIANRLGESVHDTFGCCYHHTKGLCPYLVNRTCTNPNPSCKVFMCTYLNHVKKVPNYDIHKIYVAGCFINKKEYTILFHSYFFTKDKIMEKLVKQHK